MKMSVHTYFELSAKDVDQAIRDFVTARCER